MQNNYYDREKEIKEAIAACDNALYYLNNANTHLNSAGGWGILDILGGGFVSTLVKHSKMSDAKNDLENAKRAIQILKNELMDVDRVVSLDIDTGDFLTFADFFFDGFVADWLVQSKIRSAQKQVNDAIYSIENIKYQLMQNL